MFGRFAPETRRVIELAEDHARALRRPAVGPDHLLLALLAVDDRGVLLRAGMQFDDVRAQLAEAAAVEEGAPAPPARRVPEHVPLHLREVFRSAFRHAASRGDLSVTPLHLALALVDDPPGEVAAMLRRLDLDAAVARDSVVAELDGDADGSAHKVVELRGRVVARRPAPAAAPRVSAAP